MKKILCFCLTILLMASITAYADTVKIAVASDGKTISSSVSSVAGRSPYFLIFDRSGKLIETMENPYKDARKGAGLSVVDILAQKGVKIIVAGTFGARMISAMKVRGIKYLEFKGNVDGAVKKALSY